MTHAKNCFAALFLNLSYDYMVTQHAENSFTNEPCADTDELLLQITSISSTITDGKYWSATT